MAPRDSTNRLMATIVPVAILIGVSLWLFAHGAATSRDAPVEKVVLVTIDALRADRLGCYGYRQAPTSPAIDAFANGALLFEHAYAQAPWTVPSMGSLMSGYYVRNTGAYTNRGDLVTPTATLAEQLQRAGYRTAFFDTNPLLWRPGIMRGFDSTAPVPLGEKIPYTSIEPLVMAWLDRHAHKKFFLWIHNMDTHKPLTHGNPYLDEPGWDLYDAEVRWVDEAMARLLAKLDSLGILRQVLFIFTADHGEAFGEHGLEGHQDVVYDEVLRVPLIIQYPAMSRRGRFGEPVQLLDVNPTILELTGIEEIESGGGHSLVPVMSGGAAHAERYLFSSRYYFDDDRVEPATGKVLFRRGEHHLAVHKAGWALIAKVRAKSDDPSERPDWDTTDSATYELYDLAADPLQRRDVFAAQPKVAAELRQVLDDWKRAGDKGRRDADVEAKPAAREAMRILGYEQESSTPTEFD